ncbi:MAG: DUF3750 domain-containing protein [Gammaproteobacteria bacterium]|nr:DUF3750 domain-containing protein [Gammaproteobacteria bacterium]
MLKKLFVIIAILFFLPVIIASSGALQASSDIDKISHIPQLDETAIQVYAARTWGLKKVLAVHTWVAIKHANEDKFTRYEIFGWAKYRNEDVLVAHRGGHDAPWYGNTPTILVDIRGDKAQAIIAKVEQAIDDYPYRFEYTMWPGPNSNTFTAYIGRRVPELRLDLPSTAIGKDYREIKDIVSLSPSGSGVQFSLWGLLGASAGVEEGLELNLLGLNFEIDVFDLAIELPGIGRIGAPQIKQDEHDT